MTVRHRSAHPRATDERFGTSGKPNILPSRESTAELLYSCVVGALSRASRGKAIRMQGGLPVLPSEDHQWPADHVPDRFVNRVQQVVGAKVAGITPTGRHDLEHDLWPYHADLQYRERRFIFDRRPIALKQQQWQCVWPTRGDPDPAIKHAKVILVVTRLWRERLHSRVEFFTEPISPDTCSSMHDDIPLRCGDP